MEDQESSSTSSSGNDTISQSTNVTKSPPSLPHEPSWPPSIDEMAWKPKEQRAMAQEDQMAQDIASLEQLAKQMGQTHSQKDWPNPEPSPKSPPEKNPRSPIPRHDPELGKQAPKTPPKRPSTPPKKASAPQLMQTAKWIQQPMAPTVPKQATTPSTVHPTPGWGQPTPIPQAMPRPVFLPYAAHVAPMQAWPRSAAPSHMAQPGAIASSSSQPALEKQIIIFLSNTGTKKIGPPLTG